MATTTKATATKAAASKSAAKSKKRTPMSDDHKAALAKGREEGHAVRRYLDALEKQRPRRGRRRTTDSINRRLGAIEDKLASADSLSRLHLLQERTDLQNELERTGSDDISALEKSFIKVAKSYGQRKGIGYNAWRASNVSAAVLQKAGISRAGSRG
jgi:hypothetical protein